jgi:serine/threonine protein kinase
MILEPAFFPEGYSRVRILSERHGSWVFLATNPASGFCCLKVQRLINPEALKALYETRRTLAMLSDGGPFIPIRQWGLDVASSLLWEELELADNLVTNAAFVSPDVQEYTPLTLAARIRESGPASTIQVLDWGIQLAGGLVKLHCENLFHRDVKPANVLFYRGVCVLADYGSTGKSGSSIEFPGTEGFVPPDGMGSPALDVFALGRTLYEAWTGLDCFQFPSLPNEVLEANDWETLGWQLNQVLTRASENRPSHRIPTADQLLAELKEARVPRKRISRRTAITGVAGILAASVATYYWRSLPPYKAVWRRLPPKRFGYENWVGNCLTCNWKTRKFYSLSGDTKGTVLQVVDLNTWRHSEYAFPPALYSLCSLLSVSQDEVFEVERVTGRIAAYNFESHLRRSVSDQNLGLNDFFGRPYFNPITKSIGMFGGYGDYHTSNRRYEFKWGSDRWELVAEASKTLPWPRKEWEGKQNAVAQLFPQADMTRWILFGGLGNSSGIQGEKDPDLGEYDGRFYRLYDIWELDLKNNAWHQLLPVQKWMPKGVKSAVFHPGTDSVAILCASDTTITQEARFYLKHLDDTDMPIRIPNSHATFDGFEIFPLLVEPESQDLWVFAGEGVFAVTMQRL